MATITVRPEHIQGLRYVVLSEFGAVCDSCGAFFSSEPPQPEDLAALRDLIQLGDQLGWDESSTPPAEVEVSDALLDRLLAFAWESGNEIMADVHRRRARGNVLSDPEGAERSMLAFRQHMQAQKVAD